MTHVNLSTLSQRSTLPSVFLPTAYLKLVPDKQVDFRSHTALTASTSNTFVLCCLDVRLAAEITCSQWTNFFFFPREAPARGTSASRRELFISLANG